MTERFRVLNIMTPDKRHLRAGVWDLASGSKARGICVLLNGMSEFLEKYAEVADELRARGFVVVSVDWRSQGASERGRAGNRASHVGSFDEYDSDLAALLLQVVEPMRRADPSLPMIALAHSMGGHILLRFLHEHHRHFRCAVLVAPMLEIATGAYSPRIAKAVAVAFSLRRPSLRLIFGVSDRDPLDVRFEDNQLTSDRARFERSKTLLKAQPYLRIHGPTFGWLRAAFQSLRHMNRHRFASAIETPILIVGAGHDRVVVTRATREFAQRVPNARYIEIENAEHEILMEEDTIRARFWPEFDAFVDEKLGVHVPSAARA